jgi:hypothetical protein
MSGRGRPTEAGISHAPAELFRGDVEAEIGRAFALRGDGRILLRAIERRLHLTMSAKAGEADRKEAAAPKASARRMRMEISVVAVTSA